MEIFADPLLKEMSQGPVGWVLAINDALLAEAAGFEGRPSSSLSFPFDSPVGMPVNSSGPVNHIRDTIMARRSSLH